MPFRRITILKNRRPCPAGFPLAFSSSESGWSGFLVEGLRAPETGSENGWEYLKPLVILHTQGRSNFLYRENRRKYDAVFEPDTISILPQGYEASFSWQGAFDFMAVELDDRIIDRLFHSDSSLTKQNLIPKHGIHDLRLAALLRSIEVAARSDLPTGKLYGASLSLALAAYLYEHYARNKRPAPSDAPTYRFSRAQIRRLQDYIQENVDKDLRLTELSRLVNLSPNYFCQLFRESFGASPHQYVLKQRIDLAKQMLASQRMNIADIANRLGFATQSHFTSVFRRQTGTTPRLFRMSRFLRSA